MVKKKENWFSRLPAEEKQFVSRLCDQIASIKKNHLKQVTDFIDPHLQEIAAGILKNEKNIMWAAFGGASCAERKRIVLKADEIPEYEEAQIELLSLDGKLKGKSINHRDYLGACLGLGLKREKFGDIWVTSYGCVIAMDLELSQFFRHQKIKIKNTNLNVRKIRPEDFTPPQKEAKKIFTTVSSLRVDAVSAAGFGVSRVKIAKDISAGKIKVNWQEVSRLDLLLKEGDVLSLKGKGRLILAEVAGETKKGRVKLILEKLR